MTNLRHKQFLNLIEHQLKKNGIDYTNIPLVEASNERAKGKKFSFREHLRGIIDSMLVQQRPFEGLRDKWDEIAKIFFNYDPKKIKEKKGDYFAKRLMAIQCGNRVIRQQMESLSYNIDVLLNIQKDYKTLDNFVTSEEPHIIARKIGKEGKYKLRYIGYTLAFSYLREVGIEAIKPDVHLRRIASDERLGFSEGYPSEEQTVDLFTKMAKEIGCNLSYLDVIIWRFCANICGATPRCNLCGLSRYCNHK